MDQNASDQVASSFQDILHSTSYLGFGASSFPQKQKLVLTRINYKDLLKLTITVS